MTSVCRINTMASNNSAAKINTTPNPTKNNNQPAINAFNLLSNRKLEYRDVNESTILNEFSSSQRINLFEEFYGVINNGSSKVKKENRIIIKNMLEMIVSLNKKCKAQEIEIKELNNRIESNSHQQREGSNGPSVFNSYADCVKNKEKENLIIVKKKNLNDNSNLKDLVFNHLLPIKKDVEFKKIRNRKYTLILDAKNEMQQNQVISKLQSIESISCNKPKKLIPSILIKNIERQESITDYKEYVRDELAEDLQIDKEKINVKVIINNAKFKTVRCIVNLDYDNTSKILNRGFVKIGFISCEVERTFKVHCCRDCLKFDHKTEDCKVGRLCGLCSSNHSKEDSCPARDDKSKVKCINCNDKHTSFSAKCPVRLEILNKLLNRSSC